MRARASIAAFIATVIAAVALATASSAHAVPANIIAGAPSPPAPDANVFNPTTYTHDAGTIANMTWAAGGSHNVTGTVSGADGKPIMSSDTIGSGVTAVKGSQYLPIGSYPFICTIHFGMNGTLNVNAGTPLPRPAIAVKLASKGIDKVAKKGKVNVKVTLTGAEPATVTLKLGKLPLGTRDTNKSGTLAIPISNAGKTAIGRKSKATITIDATVPFGSPVKATGKLK